ncbi:unnamed protein product [Rotaria sordida]|uniref:Uncharacterized protein n=1 Tax=Rotaria sordida TaxID=392033 RepID=A0A818SPM5_9BILA|nr:unnamed protein product [Rotaria sordida]CAF3672015.1 unnamed protein product [Rotaria sordida]
MNTTLHASLLTTEERSKSVRECSLCGSIANFACIDHCKAVLCARCTSKHRADVIQQMHELLKRLKMYQMKLANSNNISDRKSIQVSNALEQNTDNPTDSNLSVIARNSLETYFIILKEHLEKDHLLDAKTLADLDMHLNDQLDQITKKFPTLTASHNFDTNTFLLRRSRMRPQTARINLSKTITISLNIQKNFPLPFERSFSMGPHPIVVSLIDSYLETFFCQGRDNSVILLSLLSIDVYTRGSGLTWSIPLSRVLGNIKDKIFAGVWCSHIERLILVGRYYFYMFDIDRQRIRCVRKFGCGARCSSGTMPPIPRRNVTIRYRCQSTYDDCTDSRRFLASNHSGLIFYAYKSGADTYQLETHTLTYPMDSAEQEQEKQLSTYDSHNTLNDKEMKLINHLSIDGQLAAICVSYDHLAFVYRRFPRIEKSTTQLRHSLEIDHYFALYNHSLTKLADHVRLPSSIRWVTAIVSYGTEYRYLLCDPRSQQLLLYQAMDGVLNRRFHIGPVNACCLTDGRLVLWIQKAYASSPIGKLHFISTPHLEKYALVSTSFELLKKSYK